MANNNTDSTAHNEPKTLDSLSKYSYPAFTITGSTIHRGTGFLFKKEDKMYVVTNYHIRGMDFLNKKILFDADTLYFKYPIKNTFEFGISRLKIVKEGAEAIRIFAPEEDLDLYSIELNPIPPDAELYPINNLIDNNQFSKTPMSITYWGYPVRDKIIKNQFDAKIDLVTGDYRTDFDDVIDYFNKRNEPDNSKFFSGLKPIFTRNYFTTAPVAEHGFSGSPVFGKFVLEGKEYYRFMGVIFLQVNNKTWGIQPKSVLRYLDTRNGLIRD